MDEFIVQLLAQLDTSKVIKDYNDLKEKLEKQIKIKVSLDTSSQEDIFKFAEQLQTALSKVSNGKLNLDTSQIMSALNQVTKNVQQTGQQVANASTSSTATIIQNEEKKQQAYKQTAQAQTSANNQNLDLSDNTKKIEQFKQSLAKLGTVDSKYVDELSDRFEKLDIQIQSINASLSEVAVHEKGKYMGKKEILSSTLQGIDKYGQAITLTEQWDLTNHEFVKSLDAVGVSFQDVQKHVTTYQTKLNDLKTKYSNANVDYSGFEKVLSDFQKGIGTVDDLKLAFNQLEKSAKLGVQSLKSQSSSFDPIQQVLNNMRDMPSMLQTLKASMGEVKDKTSLAKISVEDLTTKYNNLQSAMSQNDGKVPLTEKWTSDYRELISTVTSATKQVEALKKAEATKQANYYSTILSNYREIYSLKKKLVTADEEETKVIKEQIRHLSSSNASIYGQLNKQGLKDSSWESQVNDLKESLDYSLRISEAHQKDKTVQSDLNDSQKKSIQIIKELEQAYQKIQNIKVKISSLDKEKDREKISTLSQEEKNAQDEYNQLHNKLRKRKNYNKDYWNETKAAIDAATQSQIEYNQANNQDKLNSAIKNEATNLASLKSKWEEQGVLVGEFKSKVEQLESSLGSVGSESKLNELKTQIQELKNEASTISKVNEIQRSIGDKGDTTTQIKTLGDSFTKLGLSADKVKAKMSSVDQELITLKDLLKSGASDTDIVSQFNKLILTLNETQNDLKMTRSEYGLLATDQQRLAKANAIEAWNLKNRNATREARSANEAYIASLRNLNVEMTSVKFNEISDGFSRIKNSMTTFGKICTAIKNQIMQARLSFISFMSLSHVVMKAVSWFTKLPSKIITLDTALVDLKKTANMSAQELEDFYYASNDVAKQMGVTTEEILKQASAWSRLGFNTAEQATQMAKLSSQFALISPGLSVDDATSGLVSIMKAYDVSVSDVLDGIESKINIIGNNLALSNANIVKMLQDSVSAMAESRNTLEETIALESAAYEIVQNESVGNGFKTVALRLRGMNEETEELDESLKTIKGDLYELTGVSIMEDKNTYKSTYQILKEISKVWDSLTDTTRAEALELMFGKQRSNIGAAVLKNFEAAEKAMDLMANSAGNANAELSVAMDSIEYKMNRLSETSTSVAQNLFKRDDMKAVVDGLTSVMNVIDKLTSKLGLFGTIGMGAGLFTGFKNIGKCRMSVRIS